MTIQGFNRTFLTQREKVQKTLTQVVTSPKAAAFNQQLKKLTGTPFLKTRDKLSFVLGVFFMIVMEYFILLNPTQFGMTDIVPANKQVLFICPYFSLF